MTLRTFSNAEHDWAMPPSEARAGHPSDRALLRSLGKSVPIAIAAWTALYFLAQIVRGWL